MTELGTVDDTGDPDDPKPLALATAMIGGYPSSQDDCVRDTLLSANVPFLKKCGTFRVGPCAQVLLHKVLSNLRSNGVTCRMLITRSAWEQWVYTLDKGVPVYSPKYLWGTSTLSPVPLYDE